ncbi:hypothetical protein HK097_007800 [Rhizophlyctis rosea]|uniref:Uncharacterized protein n=1 Tax=Rhizophlyctis rosea TaxID=64517 RepID=A0AAD5SQB1_9FUNG|nr:hypothetical protein HK097_007800 [Rhizophlyctis rosea]
MPSSTPSASDDGYDSEISSTTSSDHLITDLDFDPSITSTTFLTHCKPLLTVPQNPTEVTNPFYTSMIHSRRNAWSAANHFLPNSETRPYPIWCFDRLGKTKTKITTPIETSRVGILPVGTEIRIGGEHEDFYDPDFFIYNDVTIVIPETKETHVFQYPRDVFPPTDFHTATLVDDQIYVIGNVGYMGERGTKAQVCVLDLKTLAMAMVETDGDDPGWISRHDASLNEGGNIVVAIEKDAFCVKDGGCQPGKWVFSVADARWMKLDTQGEEQNGEGSVGR